MQTEAGDNRETKFNFTSTSGRQPINSSSKRNSIARKQSASKRARKSSEGLYEFIPDGAAIKKNSKTTATITVPRRPDIEISRSDIAQFGMPEQRNTPLEQLCCSNSPELLSSLIDRKKKTRETFLQQAYCRNSHQKSDRTRRREIPQQGEINECDA